MSHIKQILIVITFLNTTIANAGWVDKQGNQIPDSPHMKSAGNLITQLVITDNEAQVLKNWGTPSETVYFPVANKIKKGKIITAFVVFGGCATNAEGNCDLRMQMIVYKPDGSVYSNLPVMEVWSGKPVPPNKNLGLSVDYMRVIIEPNDPLGKYKIDTKIIDKISDKKMVLTSYFTAIEANE